MNHDASQSSSDKPQTKSPGPDGKPVQNGQVDARKLEDKRRTFFRLLFGQRTGIICIATAEANVGDTFKERFFKWPEQEDKIHEFITDALINHNIWYCPHLLDRAKRNKSYVVTTPTLWADLDTCNPDKLQVKPSLVIESSPQRFQALWNMQDEPPLPPEKAESLSRRIAYFHADDGVDKSGWDLTQLLRVPYTYNLKYAYKPMVKITEVDRTSTRYSINDFEAYPESEEYTYTILPFPAPDHACFKIDPDEFLHSRRARLSSRVFALYESEPDTNSSWSENLWALEVMLFEAGLTPEQVYVVVQNAACNKFARDGRSAVYLWADVCRAYSKHLRLLHQLPTFGDITASSTEKHDPIITKMEISRITKSNNTFVEDYIQWASSLGDAAIQYHQAGAFVALSAILSGSVQLETGFGTIATNLWFMILADTTLTRKTTSMDIAMDLVSEVDPDILLATDGSIEGLMTSLSLRPGRPSVFLRDEFSGLLEQMTKKDYMSGMPEALTKLYDGKNQKRVLRKDEINVRDPRLIMYAGGIKDRVTRILSYEHVSSGFIPRFVFITAEVDMTRLKPMGPPTRQNQEAKEEIRNQLIDMARHYQTLDSHTQVPTKINVQGNPDNPNATMTPYGIQTKVINATMTDDAWARYQKLEMQMTDLGYNSEMPDIYTPVYDRLSKSILKSAVLIAASRQRTIGVEVEEIDIIRAIYYGQSWKQYVDNIVRNVGLGAEERMMEDIVKFLHKHQNVSRSAIMSRWRMSAKQADFILTTMEQRMMIIRTKKGKTEIINAGPLTVRI